MTGSIAAGTVGSVAVVLAAGAVSVVAGAVGVVAGAPLAAGSAVSVEVPQAAAMQHSTTKRASSLFMPIRRYRDARMVIGLGAFVTVRLGDLLPRGEGVSAVRI